MLVSLMRALKPKVLESFKDYNAEKEFLAKINKSKKLTVLLYHGNDIPNTTILKSNYNLITNNLKRKKIVVYHYNIYRKKVF